MKNSIKILHVEDDEGHALLMNLNLHEIGLEFELIRFDCGDDFFEYLKQNFNSRFKYIVLLDIRLPKYDGMTILKMIYENETYRNFKVIMVSTSDNSVEIKESKQLGAVDYYVKPVNYENLLKRINELSLI